MRTISPCDSSAIVYSDGLFAPEDTLLQTIRTKGEALHAGMMVSAYEGKMLHLFARMIGAKHILEIGTFVGYSTLWMARALPQDGTLTTIEFNPLHAELAQGFFAQDAYAASRITLRQGAALEQLANIQQSFSHPFDLIFIDAAKGEYHDYLVLCEPMLRTGGLIIGDNTLLFGAMHGEARQRTSAKAIASMRAFNERLADNSHYSSVLVPTPEGMTVAIKIS